jgi:hypothetical protein
MLDRTLSALVAVSLAFLVWLYARCRDQEVLDNVPVPVKVTLPPGEASQYTLETPEPCQVPVSFSGPPSRIRELRGLLQRGELRVPVTLSIPEERRRESRYAETVRIQAADIHPPPGVTAVVVEGRNHIPVTLHRLVERHLPVRLDYRTEDAVADVQVEPATVLVRGPEELLDRTCVIATQPCPLPPRQEGTASSGPIALEPVPVVQELDGHPVRVTPAQVSVKVTLKPRRKVYELDLPVRFLCPADFALRPRFTEEMPEGKITLKVEGPAADDPPVVLAFIDLTRRKHESGLYLEPLRLELPRECQALPGGPPLIRFRLEPPEGTLTGAARNSEP